MRSRAFFFLNIHFEQVDFEFAFPFRVVLIPFLFSTKTMKFVLIHWVASNETSILTENFVRDKSMLDNPEKEGMVVFGDSHVKAPKSGWKSYLGRVLATSGKYKRVLNTLVP